MNHPLFTRALRPRRFAAWAASAVLLAAGAATFVSINHSSAHAGVSVATLQDCRAAASSDTSVPSAEEAFKRQPLKDNAEPSPTF